MLLRSSTVPIPTSLLPHSKESSPVAEPILHLTRTLSCTKPNLVDQTDHHTPSNLDKNNCISLKVKESDELVEGKKQKLYKKTIPSVQELFSSSGLDKEVVDDHEEYCGEGKKFRKLETLVMGGGMGKGSGRGSDVGHGNEWNFSEENNHGRDSTDAYYQNMIQANPNNPLLLGNYAKFLKEVRGEYDKAEEYLERAILANPGDANLLSLYADLIWQTEKNADRAEGYFDQAVKSAPHDCYVLASYAKFLWDVEDEEEDKEDYQHKTDHSQTYQSHFQGTHVTAASPS